MQTWCVALAACMLWACGGGDDDSGSGSGGTSGSHKDAGGDTTMSGSSGEGGGGGTHGGTGGMHGGTGGMHGSGGVHGGGGSGGMHSGSGGMTAQDAGMPDSGDMMGDEDAGPDDLCPKDPDKTEPGICGCGKTDDPSDTDGDGTADCVDKCPLDEHKTKPGLCGCGRGDGANDDADNDGTNDCNDECYLNPDKITPGLCGCDDVDDDTDGDGVEDCHDACYFDPDKVDRGVCGCLIPDTDTDGDGKKDCEDNCVHDANAEQTDADHDGVGMACDCNDGDARINSEHLEVCDTLDNNCNSMTDEGDPDGDGTPGCNCSWQTGSYAWNDITGTGTKIAALTASYDDDAASIAIGFAFAFSGASYSTALVSTNGFLMLGSNSITNASTSTNAEIPSLADPNGLIAPFWDDLINDGDGIWYQTAGTMPNRTLTVSWLNVKLFDEPTTRMSFQVILHEGGGVDFQYKDATSSTGHAQGTSASIGVENVNGMQGLPYSFDSGSVTFPLKLTRTCN